MSRDETIDVLIVEDEPEVLEGICSVVAKPELSFGRVYAIGNAEDAKELITAKRPQIIITDIVLPGQSGLELLGEVMGIDGYEPKVIVVSSYNEFAYAQRSLQLGALDYVLKPFETEEFKRKLHRLSAMIRDEARQHYELQHRLEHARMGTKLLMDQHILGFCTKKTPLQEHTYHQLQLWGLTWLTTTPYHLAAFSVSGDVPERDKEMELQLFSVGNIAEETIQSFGTSYLLKNVHNCWIVITAYPSVREMIGAIRANVKQFQRMELHVGISETMFSFQSLSEAYEQANQALRWADANRCPELRYGDMTDLAPKPQQGDLNERFVTALIDRDKNTLQRIVEEKLDLLVRYTHVVRRKQLAQSCLDWITDVQSLLNQRTGAAVDHVSLALWERLEHYETIDSVKRELLEYFGQLSAKIASQLGGMSNAIIEQAKTFIEAGDINEVTLQGLAARLAIHPVWLSHLFKKETGQTFSDYMIELRIGKAKLMLRESNLKIYEIAEKVAYQDLQHFGKTFKKRTGMTPKDYRYGK